MILSQTQQKNFLIFKIPSCAVDSYSAAQEVIDFIEEEYS
jgi:hypothetical protein